MRTARRLARRAFRAEHRLFLAEGPQAVREALRLPGCVREVFATPASASRPGRLEADPALQPDLPPGSEPGPHAELRSAALAAGVSWLVVDEAALASLTGTVHPQGVVAVCAFVDETFPDLLVRRPGLLAVCADVRDPGNAGTVIRCADASGADGVVLSGSSVDPYNGKAVRASAGSLFHLPVSLAPDTAGVLAALRAEGMTVLAADGAGEVDLDDAADDGLLTRPTAWVFGNEAWGLPAAVADLADHRVRIPIHGRAESLNLATAAAVCLYASARARRRRPPGHGSSQPPRH